jgi:hypothetical protein
MFEMTGGVLVFFEAADMSFGAALFVAALELTPIPKV